MTRVPPNSNVVLQTWLVPVYILALFVLGLTTATPTFAFTTDYSAANLTAAPSVTAPTSTPLTTTRSNWVRQNPLPTGNSLLDLSCPTANVCYSAGEGGTVLKSSDGGTTWNVQNFTGYSFISLSCPSQVVCFALDNTAGKGIARTTDGGNNWTLVYTFVAGQSLAAINCPTADTCFAVGSQELILKTSNGGNSWDTKHSSSSYNRLNDVKCINAATCVAVGDSDTILTTTNGGMTWTPQSVAGGDSSNSIIKVSCPTTSVCYAVIGYDSYLLKTTGGLDQWARSSISPAYGLYNIVCPTTEVCLGTRGTNIAKTTNGGTTWTTQDYDGPQLFQSAISCPNANLCYAAGYDGLLLKNADVANGSRWTNLSSGSRNDLTIISCLTATTCYAVGKYEPTSNNTILKTNNGGQTWITQTTGITDTLFSISCPNSTTCYGVTGIAPDDYSSPKPATNHQLVKTTDGGTNWQSSLITSTSESFYALACPTTNVCYAGGEDGTIFKTSNGGMSWILQNFKTSNGSLPPYRINHLTCVNPNVCFATTNFSQYHNNYTEILATTNGGATWSVQHHQQSYILNSLSCTSATNCLAVGGFSENAVPPNDLSYIVATTNGGATWNRLTPGNITVGLSDVKCLYGTSICYALGSAYPDYGVNAFKTADGGATWTIESINGSVSHLDCVTTSRCYAVGAKGSIFARKPRPIVTLNSDDSSGATEGTLSWALTNTTSGDQITFELGNAGPVQVNGSLPPLQKGVQLIGNCGTSGPTVEILGMSGTTNGLILQGNNYLFGLRISGFDGTPLKVMGGGNRLKCVVVAKS